MYVPSSFSHSSDVLSFMDRNRLTLPGYGPTASLAKRPLGALPFPALASGSFSTNAFSTDPGRRK